MFVEAGFILSILLALRRGKSGELTPERETAYLEAMQNCRGPSAAKVLRTTADVFQKYGCSLQATMLRRRADFLGAPESVQKQRREIIKRAMASFKPDAIDEIAAMFEYQTASGVARDLRLRAAGLRDGSIVAEATEAKVEKESADLGQQNVGEKVADKAAE